MIFPCRLGVLHATPFLAAELVFASVVGAENLGITLDFGVPLNAPPPPSQLPTSDSSGSVIALSSASCFPFPSPQLAAKPLLATSSLRWLMFIKGLFTYSEERFKNYPSGSCAW